MPIEGFPVVVTLPVQWGEMDAYQHVNNAVYLRWFESARIAYFHKMAMPGWVTPEGVGPILHTATCRYRIPVTYPDTMTIGARVDASTYGADRFTMKLAAWSDKHQKVAAEGEAIIVVFDYASQKKALLDDNIKNAIARVERG
jgi:acyl-CoA thioester hydrolase